jgi:hypothetical protein
MVIGLVTDRVGTSADAGALNRPIETPAAKRAVPHWRGGVLLAVRRTLQPIALHPPIVAVLYQQGRPLEYSRGRVHKE